MNNKMQTWRRIGGISLLALSVLLPLSAVVLPTVVDWSVATKAAWVGGLVVAGEVCAIGGVALLGKDIVKKIFNKRRFQRWWIQLRRWFRGPRPAHRPSHAQSIHSNQDAV